MLNSIVVSLGLFGASVSALGSAVVVNQCPYDVYLCDVPATGGGYEESDHTLHTGDSWSQQWTELSNGNGWSIKLSKDSALSNIMQYEYTYHTTTPDIIWYDLSDVNGNPWDANWEVSADGDNCSPKEQAYRFATDDAYGMQSCPSDSSITVILCSGTNGDNSTAPASSSDAPSPPPATTVAAPSYHAPAASSATVVSTAKVTEAALSSPSTVQAPPPATTEAPASTSAAPIWSGPWTNWGLGANGAVVAENIAARSAAVEARSLTTFATSVSAVPTEVVAASPAGRLGRRHEHVAQRHRHHHAA